MQDADPYQLFEGRGEGDAQALEDALDDLPTVQEEQHAHEAEPMAEAGMSGPAEGQDGDQLSRELTPSESGEVGSQKGSGKRPEEVLLKNRRAQRRFRERQKSKIVELEERNMELMKEVKRLHQENQTLDTRTHALVRLVHQKNAQLDQFKQTGAAPQDDAAASFSDVLSLSWNGGQSFNLTPDQVQKLNRDDLVKIWTEYVRQLAAALTNLDNSHPSAQSSCLERIKQLADELTLILLRVSITSPLVAKSFAAQCLEDQIKQEDLESVYQYIVVTLQLTAEQRTELVQLRHLFLSKQEGIARQKTEALGVLEEAQAVQPMLAGERTSSSHYIKAHDATSTLRQCLREEHALKLDFMSTVMKHLISPVQLGRLIILAYPWFPDTLALTSWLAADAGDQQAAAFFNAGSRLPHQMSAPFSLSIASRGGSGLSQGTPRNTQASLLTGSEGTYQTMAGLPSSFPGQQLMTQNSSHSGVQYAVSPANSPRYAVSQEMSAQYHGLSSGNSQYVGSPSPSADIRYHATAHNTPSPGHSPPLSPMGQARQPSMQQHQLMPLGSHLQGLPVLQGMPSGGQLLSHAQSLSSGGQGMQGLSPGSQMRSISPGSQHTGSHGQMQRLPSGGQSMLPGGMHPGHNQQMQR